MTDPAPPGAATDRTLTLSGPSRRSGIAPFIVMEVLAAANREATRVRDICHLEVGEPGAGRPPR